MVVLWCTALHVFPRTTRAGFTPVLIWLAARLLSSWCQRLVSCCLWVITFWILTEDLRTLGINSFSERCLEHVIQLDPRYEVAVPECYRTHRDAPNFGIFIRTASPEVARTSRRPSFVSVWDHPREPMQASSEQAAFRRDRADVL